ncbi:uncharacterized protein [Clytia hemisphaerica]|uniref:Uncharacterized protein n=1 Tax=Clytia hemisphaerica TaxID=252671 RepID=A0A7M5UT07_9CNID
MEERENDEFADVSTTINEINSTLNEHLFLDNSLQENKGSVSTFLKDLLSKQAESHRKIQELQRSIQDKEYQSTSSDIFSSTKTLDDLNFLESPDVSLALFMNDNDDDIDEGSQPTSNDEEVISGGELIEESRSCVSSSCGDFDELTTLGSYREIPSPIEITPNRSHIEDKFVKDITPTRTKSEIDVEHLLTNSLENKSRQEDIPLLESTFIISQSVDCHNLSDSDTNQTTVPSLKDTQYTNVGVVSTLESVASISSGIYRNIGRQNPKSPLETYKPNDCKPPVNNGDELGLCIDIMAARIKELELEKERVKLDVIVALRKQFEKLTNTDHEIHCGTLEKLNDSVCEVAVQEVEKVRNQERERRSKIEEDYQRKVDQLTDEVRDLRVDKSTLLAEVSDTRRGQSLVQEKQGKLERLQNRVSYLESLLRTVEKDNEKMKQNLKELDCENSKLLVENKTLRNEVGDVSHQLEVSRTTDSKMKDFYEKEREKMYDENKQVKDELTELGNEMMVLKQEKEKLVNSKETDISIIKHLEEKLKRQGDLLDTMSADSSRYFELNMKLENKTAQYKQKLKKSAYGIESTLEENKRLKNEKENLEGDLTVLQKSLNESKRREHDMQFQFKKLRAELEQKQRELTLHKERFHGKSLTKFSKNGMNDSYAVLDQWNDSLGRVITSSVNYHVLPCNGSRVFEKLHSASPSKFRDMNILPNRNSLIIGNSTHEDGLTSIKFNNTDQKFLNKSRDVKTSLDEIETEKSRSIRFEDYPRVHTISKVNACDTDGDINRTVSTDCYQQNQANLSRPITSTRTYQQSDTTGRFKDSYKQISNNSRHLETTSKLEDPIDRIQAANKSYETYKTNTIAINGKEIKTSLANNLQPMRLFSDSESGFEGSPVNGGDSVYPAKSWQSTTNVSPPSESGHLGNLEKKYRGHDTKLFLQEMQYKLEHSQAAMKLADTAHISSTTTNFLNSAEKIHHKIMDLRNEVLEL